MKKNSTENSSCNLIKALISRNFSVKTFCVEIVEKFVKLITYPFTKSPRHERGPLYLFDAFDDALSSSSSFLSSREGEEGSWNRTVETHSNKTFQYIDGLNPYTVYLFRVAAENALGYSKPGKESYPTLTLRERKLVIISVAN